MASKNTSMHEFQSLVHNQNPRVKKKVNFRTRKEYLEDWKMRMNQLSSIGREITGKK